jgi:hypothetical protein
MKLHCQLDPEFFRKLALRLYGEEALKTDPLGCVFGSFDWLDKVTGAAMPVHGLVNELPAQNLLISRLQEAAQARKLNPEALAEQLEVSAYKRYAAGSMAPCRAKQTARRLRSFWTTRRCKPVQPEPRN